jgi:hypothetical protein
MNIDERLEQLAERHQALTQTVELLVRHQLEWQQKGMEWQAQAEERQRKNEVLMAEVLESIHSLARVAQMRERRISELEGGRT